MLMPSRLPAEWRGYLFATLPETRLFTRYNEARELRGAAYGRIRSRFRRGSSEAGNRSSSPDYIELRHRIHSRV